MGRYAGPSGGPDRDAALAQYRRRASVYDLELALFEPVRRRAVAALALRRGDTVLDLGCGTGLSFELLQRAIGPTGHIVGLEQSPQMLERARRRVIEHGWRNVTLHQAALESAPLPPLADAALLHFTHDILRQPQALQRILSRVAPGGHVVASGLKWAPPLAMPLNLFVLGAALRSVTSLQGLEAPWNLLARWLGEPELESMFGGTIYIARWSMPEPTADPELTG